MAVLVRRSVADLELSRPGLPPAVMLAGLAAWLLGWPVEGRGGVGCTPVPRGPWNGRSKIQAPGTPDIPSWMAAKAGLQRIDRLLLMRLLR
jgi:hypothetical protein